MASRDLFSTLKTMFFELTQGHKWVLCEKLFPMQLVQGAGEQGMLGEPLTDDRVLW